MLPRLSLATRCGIPRISRSTSPCTNSWQARRWRSFQAFDANLDQEALAEARDWFSKFDESALPKGSTTYARSQGPGGQHVNKTETKAVSSWRVGELLSMLPKSLHPHIRASRNKNQQENRNKLMEEITRIYKENTPNPTSDEKKKKFEHVAEKFHEGRISSKKFKGEKKKFRKPSLD